MYRVIIFILMTIGINSCAAQESIVLSNEKVNWSDYPGLYENIENKEFSEKFKFLADVDLYKIRYLSDGLEIEAFAAIPNKVEKSPAIIFNRGGNRDFGALQLFKGKWKYPVAYYFSKLASEGYVVIGCNYRGCGESQGEEQFGGSDVRDVLHLIDVVKEIPEADAERIGMYGWSRGGMMTYLALTQTQEIKAAVVGGARSDLTVIDRPAMETGVYAELIPDYWNNKEVELKKRSAVHWADRFSKDVPVLLLHGNADWRVKSSNSLKLALEFDKHQIPYRLKIFEGGDHSLSEHRAEKDQDVIDWFDRFLKNGEKVPDMEPHGR